MTIDTLPPLREVIHNFQIKAQKNLGQNFLFDLNLTKKIASLAGDLQNKHIIEIGPGPGGLTRALLHAGAHVTAVETDRNCAPALEQIKAIYKDKLHIIYGDALTQDYLSLAQLSDKPTKIIANLPYNIGTKLLTMWLLQEDWPPFYESLTLMFQKEVAQRIVAPAGTKHYGRLSILCSWRTNSNIVYQLPAKAFTPPPKVDSAVVHMIPKAKPIICDKNKLELVTKLAFGQRRKMLRQSLKNIDGENILKQLAINPNLRAENLTPEQFIAIAKTYDEDNS